MNKVVVTGAAGFVGYQICRSLVSQNFKVIAIDNLESGLYQPTEKEARWELLRGLEGVELIKLDLAQKGYDRFLESADAIIHAAAMPGLGKSWEIFDHYVRCNLTSTQTLAEAASRLNIQKFIHISTSSVYGRNAIASEDSPLLPISPYGVTKLAAEKIVDCYRDADGLPSMVLRFFSVYGPGQRPDMAYRKFIDAALAEGEVEVYGSGRQSRTNTYVEDIARWTVNALRLGKVGETYNLSGSQPITITEALDMIEDLTGTILDKVHLEPARGDQLHTKGDIRKALEAKIIDTETPFRDGLAMQVGWQRSLGR